MLGIIYVRETRPATGPAGVNNRLLDYLRRRRLTTVVTVLASGTFMSVAVP